MVIHIYLFSTLPIIFPGAIGNIYPFNSQGNHNGCPISNNKGIIHMIKKNKSLLSKHIFTTFITIFFLIISLSNLVSCSKKDMIIDTKSIKYNVIGSKDFGFTVNILCPNKNFDVEYVRIEGENIDSMSVTVHDDTFESIENVSVSGYYVKLLGFRCSVTEQYSQIDKAVVKINSEEYVIKFDEPIKHTLKSDVSNDSSIYFTSYPAVMPTQGWSSTVYPFSATADANLIITDFYASDYINLDDSETKINDILISTLNNIFPVTLNKNSQLSVAAKFKLKETGNSSDNYNNYGFSIVLNYTTTAEPDIEKKLYLAITSQGIGNEDDAKNYIKLTLSNSK